MTQIALDAFGRTIAIGSGMGDADVGGTWQTSSNTAIGVQSGKFVYDNTGSVSKHVWLPLNTQNADELFTFSLQNAPATGDSYTISALGRVLGTADYYRLDILINDASQLLVRTKKSTTAGGQNVNIGASTDSGLTFAAATDYICRAQYEGISPTTLRVKLWAASGSEPGSWLVADTDSEATLQTTGGVGVRMLPSPGTFLSDFFMDDFSVDDMAAAGGAGEAVLLLGGL